MRLAQEKKISGDAGHYRDKVYPRDLDDALDRRVDELETELQDLEDFLGRMAAERGRARADAPETQSS